MLQVQWKNEQQSKEWKYRQAAQPHMHLTRRGREGTQGDFCTRRFWFTIFKTSPPAGSGDEHVMCNSIWSHMVEELWNRKWQAELRKNRVNAPWDFSGKKAHPVRPSHRRLKNKPPLRRTSCARVFSVWKFRNGAARKRTRNLFQRSRERRVKKEYRRRSYDEKWTNDEFVKKKRRLKNVWTLFWYIRSCRRDFLLFPGQHEFV